MTYAYDDYVQMPTKDLYDTAVMKMAIEAAKDMYDKGLALMENFYKTYGDFMSPFAKDMEWYGGEMKRIRDVVNDAYARGIDLFKSPEGRMIVSQLSHSIDPMQYNMARANAKMGYAYLDALQEAKKNGTYDPVYENWMLNQEGGPGSFEDFSTAKKGMWTVPGPSKYQDPNALVSPLFENMKDDYIDTIGGYDYSGVSRDRRALVLQANIGALLKTPNGRYLYELSKAKAEQRLGRTPTETEALSQYEDDLLNASDRFEYRTRTENKDWARQRESQLRREEDDYRSKNDVTVYQQKADIDYSQESKKLMDYDRNNIVDEKERKRYAMYGGSTDKELNIVADSSTVPGSPLQYDPNDPYKSKVAPLDGRIEFHQESKKGLGDMFYAVPNEVAGSVIYRYENGTYKPMDRGEMNGDKPWYNPWGDPEGSDLVVFVPSGNVITLPDEKGNLHSFIFGKINATEEQVLMKVKSNKHNYNK